jgi:hypothetical protein
MDMMHHNDFIYLFIFGYFKGGIVTIENVRIFYIIF